jgi:Tfp pilus assembly protein FimT
MVASTQRALHNQDGFSLTELVTIVAVIGILVAIGGYSFLEMRTRYEVENQVKQFHADILNARVRATLRNKTHYVSVSVTNYQITEDTNDSGGDAPDASDKAWFSSAKPFKYQASLSPSGWDGKVVLSTKGLVTNPTSSSISITATNPLKIRFNTSGTDPEYDCVTLSPTRIKEGKYDGTNCVPR